MFNHYILLIAFYVSDYLTKIIQYLRLRNHKKKQVFEKYHKRHVLLRFSYLGWNYERYVVQDHTIETIEHYLFKALNKVCLIKSREKLNLKKKLKLIEDH